MAATNMKQAQELFFGKDGLAVNNFKLFPGSERDITPEEIAEEINASIRRIEAGQAEQIEF